MFFNGNDNLEPDWKDWRLSLFIAMTLLLIYLFYKLQL